MLALFPQAVSQDKTVSGAHQVFMCTNKSSTDKWGEGLGQ